MPRFPLTIPGRIPGKIKEKSTIYNIVSYNTVKPKTKEVSIGKVAEHEGLTF